MISLNSDILNLIAYNYPSPKWLLTNKAMNSTINGIFKEATQFILSELPSLAVNQKSINENDQIRKFSSLVAELKKELKWLNDDQPSRFDLTSKEIIVCEFQYFKSLLSEVILKTKEIKKEDSFKFLNALTNFADENKVIDNPKIVWTTLLAAGHLKNIQSLSLI